ncbi:MAG: MCE family protein [Bdellovibrionales bacterium]|nr:MCE family protein [Bdellovibrionales bacterium]
MKDTRSNDFKVGIFVTLGVAFSMVTILVLGGAENAFTRKVNYNTHFPAANGLVTGSKVVLSGIPVGTVHEVEYEPATKLVRIEISVQRKYAEFITEGSTVEINTQGVLGDKYLGINPGGVGKELAEGADIPNLPSSDVSAFLSKTDAVMVNVNATVESLNRLLKSLERGNRLDQIIENLSSTTKGLSEFANGKNMAKSSKSLADILDKVNNGAGTLGALVNDPGLYEDARALVGGANRNRIIRNLVRESVKDGTTKQ